MGSSQRIISGVVWSTIVNVVNAVYGFIAVPILIKYFGKAEYGLIGLAMSVNVYMQLMDMGFNSTNVRFYSTWLAKNNSLRLIKGFQTSLSFYGVIGLVNAIVLLVIAAFSDKIFNVSPGQSIILKNLFYILSVCAFCQWFSSSFDQLIKATENISWLQKRTFITKLLMIFVLIVTVYGGLNIEQYYLLTCLASLSIVPLSLRKIKKEIPYISFFPKWYKSSFYEMLPYCLNIFSFSLFQFSFYNLRPVFLGIQGTVESVADYRVLNGIIGIVTMLGGAFTGILLPSTAKIVANDNTVAYYKMAYDGTKYISIMICFCCFGMMSVGDHLLTLYVGEEYLYLIPWFYLWLLCTLGTHNQAISSLILAGSDIRAITYCSVLSSIIGLISAWFLIPIYEIGGVCIAFAIYMLIQLSFYYFYYWPYKMNISSLIVFNKSFGPFVLIGGICYTIVRLIPIFANTLGMFLCRGISFAILYTCALMIILNSSDKEFIRKIVKK